MSLSDWPGLDPRFHVEPRHLFGPFYAVRIFDELKGVEVFVTGGSFLTGRSSVRRAVKYSTARYLRRDATGKHESGRRRGY
ncbi:MAG TPA: hypothetical protein VFW65_10135 [Pseudonocardiaceae bacterium]|nr:hypothetical protein [Pseudonocardiaceae bacterium]